MVAVVNDTWLEERLIRERRDAGIDRHDECWDGIYMIFAPKDNEHQHLIACLGSTLLPFGRAFLGVNVSDRRKQWEHNYRCPDVVVFLNGTTAVNCNTHWLCGPDFGVEIVSPGDRSREKLDFYAQVKTRELLIIDRDPWVLELYRLAEERLSLVDSATVENAHVLRSEVVPLSLKLVAGSPRPQIEVMHRDGKQRWTV